MTERDPSRGGIIMASGLTCPEALWFLNICRPAMERKVMIAVIERIVDIR
jgi:hypothetical protein